MDLQSKRICSSEVCIRNKGYLPPFFFIVPHKCVSSSSPFSRGCVPFCPIEWEPSVAQATQEALSFPLKGHCSCHNTRSQIPHINKLPNVTLWSLKTQNTREQLGSGSTWVLSPKRVHDLSNQKEKHQLSTGAPQRFKSGQLSDVHKRVGRLGGREGLCQPEVQSSGGVICVPTSIYTIDSPLQ